LGFSSTHQARIAELERLLGQTHVEIELLKKAFAIDSEENSRRENKANAYGHPGKPLQRFCIINILSCLSLEVRSSGYYKWQSKPEIVPCKNHDLKNQNRRFS
jgi:hypothetical protein